MFMHGWLALAWPAEGGRKPIPNISLKPLGRARCQPLHDIPRLCVHALSPLINADSDSLETLSAPFDLLNLLTTP